MRRVVEREGAPLVLGEATVVPIARLTLVARGGAVFATLRCVRVRVTDATGTREWELEAAAKA